MKLCLYIFFLQGIKWDNDHDTTIFHEERRHETTSIQRSNHWGPPGKAKPKPMVDPMEVKPVKEVKFDEKDASH